MNYLIIYLLLVYFFIFVILNYFITKKYIQKYNDTNEEIAIIVSRSKHFLIEVIAPSYGFETVALIKCLENENKKFTIYENISLDQFDKIMLNNKIKSIYLFGHGNNMEYSLNKGYVDYKKYEDKKYEKDYVFIHHCTGYKKGKNLIEFVVKDPSKKEECLKALNEITFFDRSNPMGVGAKYIDNFFFKIIYVLLYVFYYTGMFFLFLILLILVIKICVYLLSIIGVL